MRSEHCVQPQFSAVTGVLYYLAFLSNILTAVIIALALAGLFLILTAAGYLFTPPGLRYCAGKTSGWLLPGILGTILTGITALTTTLTLSSVVDIILISFGAFFFGLMLLSSLQYLWRISLSQRNLR